MSELPDLLAQRLNFDAIVFCGCTMQEMQWIAISSLIICITTLGMLMKIIIGMFLIGVGLAFPLAVGLSWGMALIFQKAKQGKPKGYLKQRYLLWLQETGLLPEIYVRRSGKWSIGRSL